MTDSDGSVAAKADGIAWKQALLGGGGLLLLIVGFTSAADVATGVVSAARGPVDNDYLLVMVFGGVALGLAGIVFVADRDSVQTRSAPEVERPTPTPVPGEPFDDRLNSWRTGVPFVGRESRTVVRERLRDTAVRVTAVDHGQSEAEAAATVANGSWTDDPVAARFLADDSGSVISSVPISALANGETPMQYRARRTVAAIDEVSGRARGEPK